MTFITPTAQPAQTLAELIDTHGAWRILRALARVVADRLRRPRARPAATGLTDHLRRDIGLPERSAPPPALRDPWL